MTVLGNEYRKHFEYIITNAETMNMCWKCLSLHIRGEGVSLNLLEMHCISKDVNNCSLRVPESLTPGDLSQLLDFVFYRWHCPGEISVRKDSCTTIKIDFKITASLVGFFFFFNPELIRKLWPLFSMASPSSNETNYFLIIFIYIQCLSRSVSLFYFLWKHFLQSYSLSFSLQEKLCTF